MKGKKVIHDVQLSFLSPKHYQMLRIALRILYLYVTFMSISLNLAKDGMTDIPQSLHDQRKSKKVAQQLWGLSVFQWLLPEN
jgi:hypothetical protein